MPTRARITATSTWRVCEGCGREYDSPTALFMAYVQIARAIDPRAVIDATEEIDFCPACGEDFYDSDEESM